MGHKPTPRKFPSDVKVPNVSIFWADTKKLLTYDERKALEFQATVVSVTPREILLQLPSTGGKTGRQICIVGLTDPTVPVPPPPKLGSA